MESGWLIEFKDGRKVITCEECYKEYLETKDRFDATYESHWFDLETCLKRNPGIDTCIKPETFKKIEKPWRNKNESKT